VTANAGDDADAVVRLEEELLRTASRRSPERLRELLDPGYLELGASGRRWDREGAIAALLEATVPRDARIANPEATPLAPGVVLLTYEVEVDGRATLRSSVWLRRGGAWRLRFHQGTPVPGRCQG
jgi:hypothetical protein